MSDPTDPRARPAAPAPDAIERLIAQLAKLPGLGPRSAQRAVLHLARRPEERLAPLAQALAEVALHAAPCAQCGNIDIGEICRICRDPKRDMREICVVEEVGDLWAIERSGAFRGRYHVLGGVLSALGGVGPEDLRIPELLARAAGDGAERPPAELILALSATVDGQTTAHVLAAAAKEAGLKVTGLARGVPFGGELGHLDDGTIGAALDARRDL